MSAITETGTTATRRPARTPNRRRREFTRAVALGATISALAVGGAWAIVGTGAGDHPAGNPASAAASNANGSTTAAGSSSGAAATGSASHASASVAALQHELALLNYYEGPIDGVMGPATLAALTDFQHANGLPADGIAGSSALAKIQQQLKTGDSQMWPTAPPVKPAKTTPSSAKYAGHQHERR
jgi:hypothetical protein